MALRWSWEGNRWVQVDVEHFEGANKAGEGVRCSSRGRAVAEAFWRKSSKNRRV